MFSKNKSKKVNNTKEIKQNALYEDLIKSLQKTIRLQEDKIAELEKMISISNFYKKIETNLNQKIVPKKKIYRNKKENNNGIKNNKSRN